MHHPADRRAILLMGPTAAGKTELALDLARQFDGEIVSVDSAQVYRGMDIGTAKPGERARAQIPHHLIDIRDPAQSYSAAEFRNDALAAMEAIRGRGRLPILAGGTGLYFRALTQGLAAMPEGDAEIRTALDAEARRAGAASLHRRLRQVDPQAARRIHPNDPQRIKRALEVFELTGKPISHWQADPPLPLDWRLLRLVAAPDSRASLHERIRVRFDAMLGEGFIGEVRGLYQREDLNPALPAMRAVGYRQVWAFLAGEYDRAEMKRRALAATRQLAKRQMTWLRREPDCLWLSGDASRADQAQKATLAWLRGSAEGGGGAFTVW